MYRTNTAFECWKKTELYRGGRFLEVTDFHDLFSYSPNPNFSFLHLWGNSLCIVQEFLGVTKVVKNVRSSISVGSISEKYGNVRKMKKSVNVYTPHLPSPLPLYLEGQNRAIMVSTGYDVNCSKLDLKHLNLTCSR